MNTQPLVDIEDLSVGFRRRGRIHHVFRDANLAIDCGDLVCLVGPSGSGKSVLLNLLIGSLRPGASGLVMNGSIRVMDHPVDRSYPSALNRRIGIVFQENALFEDLSTWKNAAFGLRDSSGNADENRVKGLLADVDLRDPPARVHELSGGQKKRLALARTLARSPEFLIYDEPTTGLDPQLCRQIADLIQRTHVAGKGKRTTLVVTHDYEAVLPVATKIFFIDPSQGSIERIESAEELEKRIERLPATRPPQERKSAISDAVSSLRFLIDTPLRWLSPVARFLGNPWPASWRQLHLRFADAFIHPALYVCAAGAVVGGLGTFFALENNPLKGAMDRQALIGVGKVLMAIVVPLITSILFAARLGAGTAARLGNIRLGRQDDALRMLGVDPGAYLITPLFWSCLIGLPLLAFPVGVACSLASLLFACISRPITFYGWASAFFDEVNHVDILCSLVKLVGSGGIVAAVAAYLGLKAKSGAEDLGRDVTGTIVAATFLVILWHGILTYIQYGL